MAFIEATNRDHRFRGWTPEKEQELKGLINRGLSAAEMGERLGHTRNAVIGKIHRMGWAIKEPQDLWAHEHIECLKKYWKLGIPVCEVRQKLIDECQSDRSEHAIAAKADRLHLTKRMVKKRVLRTRCEYQDIPEAPPIENFQPLNIPFVKLESIHCKEVVGRGDDGLAIYCGHRRQEGKSFCSVHQKINYIPERKKENEPKILRFGHWHQSRRFGATRFEGQGI